MSDDAKRDRAMTVPAESGSPGTVAEPACLSVRGLAVRWACSPSLIRRMIKSGDLACFRAGSLIRIWMADVRAYEAERCQPAIPKSPDSSGCPTGRHGTSGTSADASLQAWRIARALNRPLPASSLAKAGKATGRMVADVHGRQSRKHRPTALKCWS